MEGLTVLREEVMVLVRIGGVGGVGGLLIAVADGGEMGAQGGDKLVVVPVVMVQELVFGVGLERLRLGRRREGGREGGRGGVDVVVGGGGGGEGVVKRGGVVSLVGSE